MPTFATSGESMESCHLQTLADRIPSKSSSSFAFPRSHLDSASYRSLVLIFSLCDELDADPGSNEAQEAAPIGNGGDGAPCESLEGGTVEPDGASSEGLGHRIEQGENEKFDFLKHFEDDDFVDGDIPEDMVSGCAAEFIELVADSKEVRARCSETPILGGSENRAVGLVGELEQETCREEHNGQDFCHGSMKVCADNDGLVVGQVQMRCLLEDLQVDGEIAANLSSEEPPMVCTAQDRTTVALEDKLMPRCSEEVGFDSEIKVKTSSAMPEMVEDLVEIFESMKETRGMEKEANGGSDHSTYSSELGTDENQLNMGDNLVSDEDMEEGEIPNELQSEGECVDSADKHEANKDDKLDANLAISATEEKIWSTGSIGKVDEHNNMVDDDSKNGLLHSFADNGISKFQSVKAHCNLPVPSVNLQNLVTANARFDGHIMENFEIQDEADLSNTKVDEVCLKRKRGPLTEGKKAKKKNAKKRKRAMKEREQGVKRLKLQPMVKPKPVKPCGFYLKGRCQKGDACKFAHDAKLLTKTEPCRYFACGTCLKGEDCPFDHELSKYPCHNFISKGMCIRGDACKFSHKMLNEQGSSTLVIGKSDSPLSLQNSNLKTQANIKNTSLIQSALPKVTNSSSRFSIYKDMKENLVEKCLKPTAKMPSGVRFLSFNKGSPDDTNKQQDSSLQEINKSDDTNKQQDISLQEINKSLQCPSQKPVLKAQCDANIMLSNSASSLISTERKPSSFRSKPVASGQQSELSDATRILEEFLFGNDA